MSLFYTRPGIVTEKNKITLLAMYTRRHFVFWHPPPSSTDLVSHRCVFHQRGQRSNYGRDGGHCRCEINHLSAPRWNTLSHRCRGSNQKPFGYRPASYLKAILPPHRPGTALRHSASICCTQHRLHKPENTT